MLVNVVNKNAFTMFLSINYLDRAIQKSVDGVSRHREQNVTG